MISQTAEYALRAVVWLASQPEGSARSTGAVAAATKVPRGYLSKVLQALGRAGLVTSTAGRAGGVLLARSAEEVTVLDVINAVDPVRPIVTCPLGIPGHGTNLCPLHRRLRDAAASVHTALAGTAIADLLEEAESSQPFCEAKGAPGSVTPEGRGRAR